MKLKILFHQCLKKIKSLDILKRNKNLKEVFHIYSIKAKNRDKLVNFLKKKSIDAKIHYPKPMHLQPAYKMISLKTEKYPNTEKACKETFSLPVHEFIKKQDLDYMINNRNGHIINIGSIAGKEVYPKGNIYCASKFAVDAISQGMRIDLNNYNIKVSQINPGLVETNFSMVRFKDDKERSKAVYKDVNPLVSEDIANVIDYVISSPENVNISDITVLAKSQASSTVINRD